MNKIAAMVAGVVLAMSIAPVAHADDPDVETSSSQSCPALAKPKVTTVESDHRVDLTVTNPDSSPNVSYQWSIGSLWHPFAKRATVTRTQDRDDNVPLTVRIRAACWTSPDGPTVNSQHPDTEAVSDPIDVSPEPLNMLGPSPTPEDSGEVTLDGHWVVDPYGGLKSKMHSPSVGPAGAPGYKTPATGSRNTDGGPGVGRIDMHPRDLRGGPITGPGHPGVDRGGAVKSEPEVKKPDPRQEPVKPQPGVPQSAPAATTPQSAPAATTPPAHTAVAPSPKAVAPVLTAKVLKVSKGGVIVPLSKPGKVALIAKTRQGKTVTLPATAVVVKNGAQAVVRLTKTQQRQLRGAKVTISIDGGKPTPIKVKA